MKIKELPRHVQKEGDRIMVAQGYTANYREDVEEITNWFGWSNSPQGHQFWSTLAMAKDLESVRELIQSVLPFPEETGNFPIY